MASKLIFSVSDSEIFDAYMSAPSHFTPTILLEEGRRRSILYSKHEDSPSLARKLSRQVYGYRELQPIEEYFSHIGRADKTAAIRIGASLNQAEIKAVADELASRDNASEELTSYQDGSDVVVNAVYTETDFSRNRFRQRQQKEARIRFEIGPDSTTVIMPANMKGRELEAALRNRIEEKRKAKLDIEEVDLSTIPDAGLRTQFFITLASDFPNSTLNDVLRVKLQASTPPPSKVDLDDDDQNSDDSLSIGISATEEAVAGILRGAALSGQDLFGTSVFQELRQRGFYITSLTWHSRLNEPGNPVVEFTAEFEDAESCRSFRGSANTWKIRSATGEYNESFASIPVSKKNELVRTLQHFAMSTMQGIVGQTSSAGSTDVESGGDIEPS